MYFSFLRLQIEQTIDKQIYNLQKRVSDIATLAGSSFTPETWSKNVLAFNRAIDCLFVVVYVFRYQVEELHAYSRANIDYEQGDQSFDHIVCRTGDFLGFLEGSLWMP